MTAPAKILIIDDSDAIRDTLRLTLEFKGYDVSEAEDGRQGVQMIQNAPFDLVFCDLVMPEIDGFGVIEAVRQELKMPDLPIIIISSEDSELKRRAIKAGANASIDKPFSPKQVLSTLEEILKSPHA